MFPSLFVKSSNSSAPCLDQGKAGLASSAGAARMLGRAAVGAGLLATCLQAGAASALSFNFTFSGGGNPASPTTVTGVVSGLVDNTSNQKSGLTVTISSATNTPSGGWSSFSDPNYIAGDGFDVFGGVVTGVDIGYINGIQAFDLGNQNNFLPSLLEPDPSGLNVYNRDFNNASNNSLVFTPVGGPSPAAAPGPLPLFGAAAAFGWGRRLRRRVNTPA